jgi:hypothetical protein
VEVKEYANIRRQNKTVKIVKVARYVSIAFKSNLAMNVHLQEFVNITRIVTTVSIAEEREPVSIVC